MSGYTTAAVLAVSVISAAVGTAGAIQQNQTAQAQSSYQAQVARNNAILADRAAKRAEQQGEIAAKNNADKARALKGRQLASLAANGVDVGSGTAVDILGDTAAQAQLDQNTIRDNALQTANNYRAQGSQFRSESDLYGSSSPGTFSGVGGTLLTGTGKVADKWYQLDQAGAFDSTSTPYDNWTMTGGHAAATNGF